MRTIPGQARTDAGDGGLSRRTEQQAASLEETAASMEQPTSTVKQNTARASRPARGRRRRGRLAGR